MEKKILIISDVHGRDFWRKPVKDILDNTDSKVIFLGDYLDPYPHEWTDIDGNSSIDYRKKSIEGLKDIINLKKEYKDRIVLLLGNHDSYIWEDGEELCNCRHDYRNMSMICELYRENKDLFQMAHKETINDKDFIFSHAGISRKYIDYAFGKDNKITKDNVVNYVNNGFESNDERFFRSLLLYSNYRGWSLYEYGSMVWSDIREWCHTKPEDTYGINIVGHTMSSVPIYFKDVIYNLDIAGEDSFYIDENGDVRYYSNNNVVEETKID